MSSKPVSAGQTSLRGGMSLMEVTVTLAIIAVLAVVIAQCAYWSGLERGRMASHQAALELATNALEAARALPWDKLDQAWADAQTIPADMATLLPDGKLVVTVAPEPRQPLTRRVTAEVRWQLEAHLPPQSEQLTTLLSERTAKKSGGRP
jgi:prepilin-type N-terminal cleavage/methylation domain-containing protein